MRLFFLIRRIPSLKNKKLKCRDSFIAMKQKTLFKLKDYTSEFGGALLTRRRKTRRPFSRNNAMHVVLRRSDSTDRSFLKSRSLIESYFRRYAQRFGVKLYKTAIVSNHIHLVARFDSRIRYVGFVRALTGQLAKQLKIKWALRPWTRILKWGRDLNTAIQYTIQNHLEAVGTIAYKERRRNARPLLL